MLKIPCGTTFVVPRGSTLTFKHSDNFLRDELAKAVIHFNFKWPEENIKDNNIYLLEDEYYFSMIGVEENIKNDFLFIGTQVNFNSLIDHIKSHPENFI